MIPASLHHWWSHAWPGIVSTAAWVPAFAWHHRKLMARIDELQHNHRQVLRWLTMIRDEQQTRGDAQDARDDT